MNSHAIWFSRHQPTDAQIKEIEALGFSLSAEDIAEGVRLGLRNVDDEDANAELTDTLMDRCTVGDKPAAIFGVWPAPILEQLGLAAELFLDRRHVPTHAVPCYAAWNVRRTVPGQPPTFEHKRWCKVGYLMGYITPPSVEKEQSLKAKTPYRQK